LPFRLCSWAYDANPAAKIATLLRFSGGKAADAASSPFEHITKQNRYFGFGYFDPYFCLPGVSGFGI
jgi:hypothetical protein